MKKIKKFKINLRSREIARLLKATAKTEITPQLEEAIQRESSRLATLISPAAVYETQPKEKIHAALAANAPDKWVAASAYIVTIGSDVENEIRDAQAKNEAMLSQILHAVALEALEQTDNFVQRLLVAEAQDESCDLSRRQPVTSGAAWPAFTELLPGDKIGVQLVADDQFQPMYASAGMVFWTPAKKKTAK